MSLSRCSLHHLAHVDFSTSKFRDRNKFRLQFWQHRKFVEEVLVYCNLFVHKSNIFITDNAGQKALFFLLGCRFNYFASTNEE